MQRKIVLSHSILQEVERLQANNKISAIKLVRKHGKAYPAAEGHNEPHSVGLREAKEAVEHAYTPSRIDIGHRARSLAPDLESRSFWSRLQAKVRSN